MALKDKAAVEKQPFFLNCGIISPDSAPSCWMGTFHALSESTGSPSTYAHRLHFQTAISCRVHCLENVCLE